MTAREAGTPSRLVRSNPLLDGRAACCLGVTTGKPLFVVLPLIPSHEDADENDQVETGPIGCWRKSGRAPRAGRHW